MNTSRRSLAGRERDRQWREDNREAINAKQRAYYAANAESLRQYGRDYYSRNRERIVAAANAKFKANPELSLQRNAANRLRLRQRVVELLGAKCRCCGETEFYFLELDHIHGGGRRHFAELGTWGVLRQVLADQDRDKTFRLLCANCNKARSRCGTCPHGNGI